LTGSLLVTACGAAGTTNDDRGNRPASSESVETNGALLARIDYDDGNVIDFHEVDPGAIVVFESGHYPNPSRLADPGLAGASAPAIFRKLVPARPLPDEIMAAQARAEARMAQESTTAFTEIDDISDDEPDSESVPPIAAGADDSAYPANTFRRQACCNESWEVCWVNRTGNPWFERGRNNTTRTAAASYRGSVTFRFKVKKSLRWETLVSATLNTGDYKSTLHANFFNRFRSRSEITGGTGDGFHLAGCGDR
jgi:hypothetical protein